MTLLPFLFPPPLNCLSMQTMFCFFTLLIVLLTSLPSTLTCGQSLFGCHKNHYVSTSQSLNTCFSPFEFSLLLITFFVSISGSCLERVRSYKYLGVLLAPSLIPRLSRSLLRGRGAPPPARVSESAWGRGYSYANPILDTSHKLDLSALKLSAS